MTDLAPAPVPTRWQLDQRLAIEIDPDLAVRVGISQGMVESVTIRAGRQVQLEAMLVCRVPSGQTLLIVTILKPKLVKLISFRDYHHPRLAPDSVS